MWWATTSRAVSFNYNDGNFHINCNNNIDNNSGRSRGMALALSGCRIMRTYKSLYPKICSMDNLVLAWKKARKRKTQKQYVVEFEKDLLQNLESLRVELLLHSYRPLPLHTFVIKDPKTRKISVSNFRDRIVHHAICNVIGPIFEKRFIHDSYANRADKGTLAAIKRLQKFICKVSRNKSIVNKFGNKNVRGFVLKCDIKKYFDNIGHEKLISIIKRRLKDGRAIFLIRTILGNHSSKEEGIGMPLGNLTSQFFGNVYLNELDQYVKHNLKARYYLRYVDDFVVLHSDVKCLLSIKQDINLFLQQSLLIELNEDKSRIRPLSRGIDFLGFRIFSHHILLRERNVRKAYKKIIRLKIEYDKKSILYDEIYEFLQGWIAYAKLADSYNLRTRFLKVSEILFPNEMSTIEINRVQKLLKKMD